jgi:hypothetical protein
MAFLEQKRRLARHCYVSVAEGTAGAVENTAL